MPCTVDEALGDATVEVTTTLTVLAKALSRTLLELLIISALAHVLQSHRFVC